MDNLELCARNVSAALREARNAYNAAKEMKDGEGVRRKLDDIVHHLEGLALSLRLRQEEQKPPQPDYTKAS